MRTRVIITNTTHMLGSICSYLSGYFIESPSLIREQYDSTNDIILEKDESLEYFRVNLVNVLGRSEDYCDMKIIDLDNNKLIHHFERETTNTIVNISDDSTWVDWSGDKDSTEVKEEVPKFDFENNTIDFVTATNEEVLQFSELLTEKLSKINDLMSVEPKVGDLVRWFSEEWSSPVDWNTGTFLENFKEYKKYCDSNGYTGYGKWRLSKCRYVTDKIVELERYGRYNKHMCQVLDPDTLEVKVVDDSKIEEAVKEVQTFCHANNYHDIDEQIEQMLGGLNGNEN